MKNDINKIKSFLIENPSFILNDVDILNSLLSSIPKQSGKNIVDLRGIFSERLEEKYNTLEETHKTVVATVHENITTSKSINRAVLRVLEVKTLLGFLEILNTDIKSIFKLTDIFLCFDSIELLSESWPDHKCLHLMKEGECCKYFDLEPGSVPLRNVLLRRLSPDRLFLNNDTYSQIQSEAIIGLTLTDSKELVLLVMGSTDPYYFNPNQATDLLAFLGKALEKHLNNFLFKNNVK